MDDDIGLQRTDALPLVRAHHHGSRGDRKMIKV